MEEALLKRITTGAAVHIKGSLVESQGKGQDVEIQVSSVEILGDADPELVSKTILQPKTPLIRILARASSSSSTN